MAFIKHEACPNCGSRDNLAVYTNGKWCFGCGHTERAEDLESIRARLSPIDVEKQVNGLIEVTSDLPSVAKKWLMQYGLTLEEMKQFSWCTLRQASGRELVCKLLILLQNNDYWQGRNFGEGAKYISSGLKPLTIYGNNANIFELSNMRESEGRSLLVMVEDVVSAVKLSRHCSAMPLLGTSLSKAWLLQIAGKYDKYVIWLDRDKATHAVRLHNQCKQILGDVSVIVTDEDPKEKSDKEIKELLYEMDNTRRSEKNSRRQL